MDKKKAVMYVFFTYLLSWAIAIPAVLAKQLQLKFTVPGGLLICASLVPGLVSVMLTFYFSGKAGLLDLLKRIIKVKAGRNNYLVILCCGLLLPVSVLLLYNAVTGLKTDITDWKDYIFIFIIYFFFSPLWEETGWRGFLFPNLQNSFSPLSSSLITGMIWGLWHLPLFIALDPYGKNTFEFFVIIFIGCLALSVILGYLYNQSKSIFICILLHDLINTSTPVFFADSLKKNFNVLICYTGTLVLFAIVLIYLGKLQLNSHNKKPL